MGFKRILKHYLTTHSSIEEYHMTRYMWGTSILLIAYVIFLLYCTSFISYFILTLFTYIIITCCFITFYAFVMLLVFLMLYKKRRFECFILLHTQTHSHIHYDYFYIMLGYSDPYKDLLNVNNDPRKTLYNTHIYRCETAPLKQITETLTNNIFHGSQHNRGLNAGYAKRVTEKGVLTSKATSTLFLK